LDIDDYFLPDLKIKPIVSKVTNNITVNTEDYLNEIYPFNGTVEKTVGYETQKVKINVPSVAIILCLSVIAIISITTAILFYYKDKAE